MQRRDAIQPDTPARDSPVVHSTRFFSTDERTAVKDQTFGKDFQMSESTKQMIGPNQENWLAALESGEYRQGRRKLKQQCESGFSYCCLGVACELAGESQEPHSELPSVIAFGEGREIGGLTEAVQKRFAFHSVLARILDGRKLREQSVLAFANDSGATFKEIASFVRENPAAVFTEPR